MVITAMRRTPRRRGRIDLYVDGELALQIGVQLARDNDLRPGSTLDKAQLDALARVDEQRRAMHAAAAMLARRPHSERELRRKLGRQRVDDGVTNETIAKLRTARLVDDAAFAHAWVAARNETSPRGSRLLAQELRLRGVGMELAVEAAASIADDDAAYRAAARRSRMMRSMDFLTYRTRLASFLQRRGFGWETAKSAIERCWEEQTGTRADDDLTRAIE